MLLVQGSIGEMSSAPEAPVQGGDQEQVARRVYAGMQMIEVRKELTHRTDRHRRMLIT